MFCQIQCIKHKHNLWIPTQRWRTKIRYQIKFDGWYCISRRLDDNGILIYLQIYWSTLYVIIPMQDGIFHQLVNNL